VVHRPIGPADPAGSPPCSAESPPACFILRLLSVISNVQSVIITTSPNRD